MLHLLCFRLTCYTQLVNCPSISSWRPTHAHVCMWSGGVVRMALHQRINWVSASTECHCQFSVFKHWEYTVLCQEFFHRALSNLILTDLFCPGDPSVFKPHGHTQSGYSQAMPCSAVMSSEMRAPEHTETNVRTKKCSFSCQGFPAWASLLQLPRQRMSCCSERVAGGTGTEESPATEPPAQGHQCN